MAHSRFVLKALGICATVLGLVACIAGSAQAEVNSHWNVAGKSVTGTEEKQLEIKELENKTITVHITTKSGILLKLLCTRVIIIIGNKLTKEGGVSLGRLLLTECIIELNNKLAPACQPHSPGKPVGEILTENAKGLIVLDTVSGKVEDYVKIVPDEGLTLAKIEMGEECAIGALVKIEAKAAGEGLWLKDSGGNAGFTAESSTHLFQESLHGLIALGQPAVIEGSAIVQLAGGLTTWSGTPG
jgi:hypothetical protein